MSLRISDFFFIDLLDEQHHWSLSDIAMFYQTTEEEVQSALIKANAKFKEDPRSTDYDQPNSNDQRYSIDASEAALRDVPSDPGKDWFESSA